MTSNNKTEMAKNENTRELILELKFWQCDNTCVRNNRFLWEFFLSISRGRTKQKFKRYAEPVIDIVPVPSYIATHNIISCKKWIYWLSAFLYFNIEYQACDDRLVLRSVLYCEWFWNLLSVIFVLPFCLNFFFGPVSYLGTDQWSVILASFCQLDIWTSCICTWTM